MASNKDKLLESAQKNLKKKQLARAIKDFAKVVELDPGDVRSRQKLAELYVRTGKSLDAYEQYEAVAKFFSSNGFYLKAIAIYKQMQRLDSSQIALFSRLAELNEKQGLIGNAMTEYRSLVDYYERNGMLADAIKTLEKMRDMDPANLNVRVKLAEVYATNEREDDGLVEFDSVLADLSDKNEFDKILKLYKLFMPLYPNNQKLQLGLALTLFEKGAISKGLSILISLLQDKPEDPDILRLIARGYDDLEDWDNASETYRTLLRLDPTDLDPREALIRCYIGQEEFVQALTELEEWKESFFKADRLQQLKEFYETLKEELSGNAVVLQTLDSIYELTGEGGKLLDIISEQEDEPIEIIVDEALSDSLLSSVDEDIEVPLLNLEDESELVDDFLIEASEEEMDLQLEPVEETLDLTIDGDDSDQVMELQLSDEEDASIENDLGFSFDLDADESGPEATPDSHRDLTSDLEETEFYIQQGLFVEAEKLCQDILAYAPDSVECQQKLTEIQTHLQTESQPEAVDLEDMAADILADELSSLDVVESIEDPATADAQAEQKLFRTDVDEQIAADDMESHYNLGIAYREMGLLDDAISEFGKAETEPARYVDCQTLKGLCYVDKSDYTNAELVFQQALDSPHLESEQRLSLSYELGSLYELADRFDEALSSFQIVSTQDSSFRDVADKVSQLQDKLNISADGPAEELESKERISFL